MTSKRALFVLCLAAALALPSAYVAGAGQGDQGEPSDGDRAGASDPGEDAMVLAGIVIGIALVLLGTLRGLLARLRQRDEGTW